MWKMYRHFIAIVAVVVFQFYFIFRRNIAESLILIIVAKVLNKLMNETLIQHTGMRMNPKEVQRKCYDR